MNHKFFVYGAICLLLSGQSGAQDDRDAVLGELQNQLEQTRQELAQLREKVQTMTPPAAPSAPTAVRPARPVTTIRPPVAPRIAITREPRPMLGIVMDGSQDRRGVRLSAVTPDGPADRAGLRAGDIIVAIDGTTLEGRNALDKAYKLLDKMKENQEFAFDIKRDSETLSIALKAELVEPALAFGFTSPRFDGAGNDFAFGWNSDNQMLDLERFREWASENQRWSVLAGSGLTDRSKLALGRNLPMIWSTGLSWTDLELAAINPDLGRYFGADKGVLVIDTQLGDKALKAGDVILTVDGKSIAQPSDAMRALQRFEPGDEVPMSVLRDGRELALLVVTPEAPANSFFYQFRDDNEN